MGAEIISQDFWLKRLCLMTFIQTNDLVDLGVGGNQTVCQLLKNGIRFNFNNPSLQIPVFEIVLISSNFF